MRPPERARSPQTVAEHETRPSGANRDRSRSPRVASSALRRKDGQQHRGGPEADRARRRPGDNRGPSFLEQSDPDESRSPIRRRIARRRGGGSVGAPIVTWPVIASSPISAESARKPQPSTGGEQPDRSPDRRIRSSMASGRSIRAITIVATSTATDERPYAGSRRGSAIVPADRLLIPSSGRNIAPCTTA